MFITSALRIKASAMPYSTPKKMQSQPATNYFF